MTYVNIEYKSPQNISVPAKTRTEGLQNTRHTRQLELIFP